MVEINCFQSTWDQPRPA